MGRDEQIEERGVLAAIFPDEITDISDTSYAVSIALDISNQQDEDAEPPSILLEVSYPPTYPSLAPDLSLSHLPDFPKPPHLILPDDSSYLLSTLETPINDSLGEAMVFTLISTLKESTESLIASRIEAVQEEKDQEAAEAERKENAKFHGEAVTRESFLAWRERFHGELREREEGERRREEEHKGKKIREEEKKLTGRELWERGLVGKGEEEDEDVDVGVGVGGLKVQD